jgi:hypothetical protein
VIFFALEYGVFVHHDYCNLATAEFPSWNHLELHIEMSLPSWNHDVDALAVHIGMLYPRWVSVKNVAGVDSLDVGMADVHGMAGAPEWRPTKMYLSSPGHRGW